MRLGLLLSVLILVGATEASAYCIVNRTGDVVAYTRGGPFAGMETFYMGGVQPGAQSCMNIGPRIDGTYPVSIYTIKKRGNCTVVSGCYFESSAEQIFFRGTASSSCPIAFQDNTCS